MKPEHKRFAELYACGMSATRAYMECYPNCSYDSAQSCAWKLLRKPEVHDYVVVKQQEFYDSLAITPEKILTKLAEMAFADKDDEIYTPSVAQKALDMMQKQMGLQKQKLDANIDTPTTIKVTVKPKEETNNEGQNGD